MATARSETGLHAVRFFNVRHPHRNEIAQFALSVESVFGRDHLVDLRYPHRGSELQPCVEALHHVVARLIGGSWEAPRAQPVLLGEIGKPMIESCLVRRFPVESFPSISVRRSGLRLPRSRERLEEQSVSGLWLRGFL